MNKENPKKNKKSFEYYIAQRKEEFRCQYDHERSWENLQYKLEKRRKRRISLYCVAASAALLFLILGISHIFFLHNNTQNKEAVVAAVISFPETGSRKAILVLRVIVEKISHRGYRLICPARNCSPYFFPQNTDSMLPQTFLLFSHGQHIPSDYTALLLLPAPAILKYIFSSLCTPFIFAKFIYRYLLHAL